MKSLHSFLFTFLLWILLITTTYPLNNSIIVRGIILDSETALPIKNALVFLSFSTYQTQTDENGEFRLSDVIPGKYALVYLAEGYEKSSTRIDVDGKMNLRANLVLEKNINTLDSTKFFGVPTFIERYKFVEKFKKEFLGESIRTFKCEIINEQDLDFTHNGIEIFASSSKPIEIINKTLGYKLVIFLNKFRWEWFSDFGSFSFDVFFVEIKPMESYEAIKYAANRLEAYKGSFRHFLTACVNGTAYSQGFVVFNCNYVPKELGDYEEFKEGVESVRPSTMKKLIQSIIKEDEKEDYYFEHDTYLEVIYTKMKEEENYSQYKERIFSTNLIYDFQDSWVNFPGGKYHFTSRGIGLENEQYGKQLFGYWNWKRVADILPSDYEPLELE